MDYPKIKVYQD